MLRGDANHAAPWGGGRCVSRDVGAPFCPALHSVRGRGGSAPAPLPAPTATGAALGRRRGRSLTPVNDSPPGASRCQRRRWANSSPGLRARGQRGGAAEERGAPLGGARGALPVRGGRGWGGVRTPCGEHGGGRPHLGVTAPGCPGSVPAVLPEAGLGPAGGRGGAVLQDPVKAAVAGGGGQRWAARGNGARARATRGPCGGTASTGGVGTAGGLAGSGGNRTWGCGARAWGRTGGEGTWGGEQDPKEGPRGSGKGEDPWRFGRGQKPWVSCRLAGMGAGRNRGSLSPLRALHTLCTPSLLQLHFQLYSPFFCSNNLLWGPWAGMSTQPSQSTDQRLG